MHIPPAPPVPPARPRTVTYHGAPWHDEHFALRDAPDDAALAWFAAEGRYADALLADTAPAQAEMAAEMERRLPPGTESVPARDGAWLHRSRLAPGRRYPRFERRPAEGGADFAAVLDLETEADGHAFTRLADLAFSPDGRFLAYSIDHRGDEEHTLRVRDLETGRDLPDRIDRAGYGIAWSACGKFLFFTALEPNGRSSECRRHRLGDDPADAALIHREEDPGAFVHTGRSSDGAFILIHSASQSASGALALPADRPGDAPRTVAPRRPEIECRIDHGGGFFYLLTNEAARDFRLLRVPSAAPDAAPETVIAHEPGVTLEHLHALDRAVVVHARERGRPAILVVDPRDLSRRAVRFPDPAYALSPGENRDFASAFWRFVKETPAEPPATIDLDLSTLTQSVRRVEPVPGHDPARYRVELLSVPARDGVAVPLTLLSRADLPRDRPAPVYLHGYGAYGVVEEDEFRHERFALVDRGWIYAVAHPRGGGELGRDWYEAGRRERKGNTFRDAIDCVEHLIALGRTAPGLVCAFGRSAGGLLAGALLTMRPELFGAVIAEVPFTDILNTMMDPALPLTVREYDEWGDPNDPAVFGRIRAYAPYENIGARDYPPTLLTGGLADPRVGFWEPAKMLARLRGRGRGGPFLLVMKGAEGHRHDAARGAGFADHARKYAFAAKAISGGFGK